MSFSPDGRRLAAIVPGTVQVLEAASGQEVYTLNGHTTPVTGVAFSPDGQRIVARGQQGDLRCWDATSGQEVVPCTDPSPPENQREAVSPDGKLRIWADGNTVRAARTDDRRPPSDLVFLERLNDPAIRRHWHKAEADDATSAGHWLAVAHHLGQLRQMVDPADDLSALRVRYLRARTLQHAADVKPLLDAAQRPPDQAGDGERTLADLYSLLDAPPHLAPSWLGAGHPDLLAALRAAEERLLRSPAGR
jgi:hypothetical protein